MLDKMTSFFAVQDFSLENVHPPYFENAGATPLLFQGQHVTALTSNWNKLDQRLLLNSLLASSYS